VLVCGTPYRIPWREQAFMSWAGLRGAVPIVLATIPITVGLPAAERIFDVIFLLVVVFTLVQGPTLPLAARLLGVAETSATREVNIDSAPLEDIDATLLQFTVPAESKLAGVYLRELRLPGDAAITLIHRDGEIFVPDRNTVLRTRDHLLLATSNQVRTATERRLRAISRAGKLATWRGERGDPVAETPRPSPTVKLPQVGPWRDTRRETTFSRAMAAFASASGTDTQGLKPRPANELVNDDEGDEA
jgi:potassium/hydrogen antiporter